MRTSPARPSPRGSGGPRARERGGAGREGSVPPAHGASAGLPPAPPPGGILTPPSGRAPPDRPRSRQDGDAASPSPPSGAGSGRPGLHQAPGPRVGGRCSAEPGRPGAPVAGAIPAEPSPSPALALPAERRRPGPLYRRLKIARRAPPARQRGDSPRANPRPPPGPSPAPGPAPRRPLVLSDFMSPLFTLHGHTLSAGRPPPRSHGCAQSRAEGGSVGRGKSRRRREGGGGGRGRDYKLARMGWGWGGKGRGGGERSDRERGEKKKATSQNKEQRLH